MNANHSEIPVISRNLYSLIFKLTNSYYGLTLKVDQREEEDDDVERERRKKKKKYGSSVEHITCKNLLHAYQIS